MRGRPTNREMTGKPRDPAEVALEEQMAREELLKKHPPNKKFYSFTTMDDTSWRRYDALPTVELLDEKKAIVWTGGLIGGAAGNLGSFIVTGIHHGGRVIEFEFAYKTDSDGHLVVYNPTF
jgi:hypothetical protein